MKPLSVSLNWRKALQHLDRPEMQNKWKQVHSYSEAEFHMKVNIWLKYLTNPSALELNAK